MMTKTKYKYDSYRKKNSEVRQNEHRFGGVRYVTESPASLMPRCGMLPPSLTQSSFLPTGMAPILLSLSLLLAADVLVA